MYFCEVAFSDFCDRYWPCGFQRKGVRCVGVALTHDAKGHQSANGKVLATGSYEPSYSYTHELRNWFRELEAFVHEFQEIKDKRCLSRPDLNPDRITSELHSGNLQLFYGSIGSADRFKSHSTCLSCLREIPEHPLICGHVLCTLCVKMYGVAKNKELIKLSRCPLDGTKETWSSSCHVSFKPPLAGVRVLSLDG